MCGPENTGPEIGKFSTSTEAVSSPRATAIVALPSGSPVMRHHFPPTSVSGAGLSPIFAVGVPVPPAISRRASPPLTMSGRDETTVTLTAPVLVAPSPASAPDSEPEFDEHAPRTVSATTHVNRAPHRRSCTLSPWAARPGTAAPGVRTLRRRKGGIMSLRIVGAGVGRTGTHSLKHALEQLLGAPCYHMVEVFPRPDHVPIWTAALQGEPTDWDALFEGFVATVDWPACSAWEAIWAANPDALVLLSTRASTDEWYRSATRTIFEGMRSMHGGDDPFTAMTTAMGQAFGADWADEASWKAAYERHNAH